MTPDDPKLSRIRYDAQPYSRDCPKCLASRTWHHHLWDCPAATVDDLRHHIQQEKKRVAWAQKKAETWLHQVRLTHGTIANLKAEVRRLRKRLKPTEL